MSSHAGSSRPDPIHGSSSHGGSIKGSVSLISSSHVPSSQAIPDHVHPKFHERINNWPQRSLAGELGKTFAHEYASFHDIHHQFDTRITQEPLDWKEVKWRSKEGREDQIIQRANYYTQTQPDLMRLPSYFTEIISEAEEAGRCRMIRPWPVIKLDRARLLKTFHFWESEEEEAASTPQNRMNAEAIKSTMQQSMKDFERHGLRKLLDQFLTTNLPREMPCKKIVVFGGVAMSLAKAEKSATSHKYCYAADYPHWCQIQHAAVMSIRDMLEIHYNTKLPLYLQGPSYTQEDKRAADKFAKPVKIVNDLSTSTDGFYRQFFEFARPAAILSSLPFVGNAAHDKLKSPYSFHIWTPVGMCPYQADYPGLGIENYTSGILNVLREDYTKIDMDTQEHDYITHPTLYLRKNHSEMKHASNKAAR